LFSNRVNRAHCAMGPRARAASCLPRTLSLPPSPADARSCMSVARVPPPAAVARQRRRPCPPTGGRCRPPMPCLTALEPPLSPPPCLPSAAFLSPSPPTVRPSPRPTLPRTTPTHPRALPSSYRPPETVWTTATASPWETQPLRRRLPRLQ
jgi:hypothetical protein